VEHLIDHLFGGEITAQAEAAGGTEGAADGAADLCRDADRGAPWRLHEHRLDRMPVRGGEERLARRSMRREARLHLVEASGRSRSPSARRSGIGRVVIAAKSVTRPRVSASYT